MWTEDKQKQFDALREKECAGTLNADEQAQLDAFFAELNAEEAELLRPAMERMAQERQQQEAEIARLHRQKGLLADLAAQEERLLQRAQAVLQEVQTEKVRIRSEYALALAEEARVA
ncbi:MAG: hypothetical protein HOP19_20635 [Acidobacteria bacterium]|nr:hypothetical protein [Acidobacteriota bacterium]